MTTLEVLKAARELISDESRWTQGAYARDKSGVKVKPNGRSAVCWCAMGAIGKVTDQDLMGDMSSWTAFSCREAINKLSRYNEPYEISYINDHHIHAEVLALFDSAIGRLEDGA